LAGIDHGWRMEQHAEAPGVRVPRLPRFVACVAALIGCASPVPDCDAPPDAPAITIVYVHAGNAPPAHFGVDLEAAVWPDGRLVWTADAASQPPVLLASSIEPERVVTFLEDLCARGIFDDPAYSTPHFGPDGDYVMIRVAWGGRCVKLGSWHEIEEAHGVYVPRESGAKVLAERWARFRSAWTDIRLEVASWIPPTGEPFTGTIDLRSAR